MKDTQKNLLEFIEKSFMLTRDALKAVQNNEFDKVIAIMEKKH